MKTQDPYQYNRHISHTEEARNYLINQKRLAIPVCPKCHIHCSICAQQGQHGKCCLEQ